ncbi:MAG TPA: CRISPR-associated helicase Cas3' [Planctomycetota bacterium]|nr:CRISPR-associated helicase Cas3' [Planctomycetota bacterium]
MAKELQIAHVAELGEGLHRVQTVEEHSQAVARLAAQFCRSFPWSSWSRLAGLWHDIGKCSEDFQQRIRGKPIRVDHSSAGAQHAVKVLHDFGRVLAYCIAGHHAGLPNGASNDDAALTHRLRKTIPDFSTCPASLLEARPLSPPPFLPTPRLPGFSLAFFTRMIYSCLVDADFLDTERFMNPEAAEYRGKHPQLAELDAKLTAHLAALSARSEGPVNRHRATVLQQCLAAAELPPGFFSLTVPTGGGKTLSSLAFALKHALKHDLDRVIYVIPYTSIIEQNAAVFRSAIGDDALLEHHSNFDPRLKEDDDVSNGALRARLATENWDAPLVVTTNVQFFESLFAYRSSRCRKLHNILNSVVILDEAQMLPVHLLRPCMEALRELTLYYRATIVLCTATQPALSASPTFTNGLDGVREIISRPEDLYSALKRVSVSDLGKLPDVELAERLRRHEQVLCIVNTRGHARKLFDLLSGTPGLYHLSANMCPAHRSLKFAEIRAALAADKPCRVVSTQLVEAGVDVDFPVVYRSMAGIDSIAQAAGRCNREGKLSTGTVFTFNPEDQRSEGHVRQTAETAEFVGRHHSDPLSLDAVRAYFHAFYWAKGDYLDHKNILTQLADGKGGDIPFRKVGDQFHLIEDITKPIIIPFDGRARELLQAIRSFEFPPSLSRRLQRYTVAVYQKQFDTLVNAGAVEILHEQFPVLVNTDLYRDDLGLCAEEPTFHRPENLIA